MRGYMFRNRWGALLFVGLTLAGVTTLVGTEREDGALQQAADQIAEQRAQAERMTENLDAAFADEAAAADDGAVVMMADEEDLIDPAVGEDPTPIDEFAAANPDDSHEPAEEVIIVSREDAGDPALQQ